MGKKTSKRERKRKSASRRQPVGADMPGMMPQVPLGGMHGIPGLGPTIPGAGSVRGPDMSESLSMIDRQIQQMEEQKKRIVQQLDDAINRLKDQKESMARSFLRFGTTSAKPNGS